MVLKNCLKISYKGLTRNIFCDANACYEDIVTKVMQTFDLMDDYRNAVEIYDEHGCKFNKEVLEYFVLLFPNPQKLFFIRLDVSKCLSIIATPKKDDVNPKRTAFSVTKSVNKIKENRTTTVCTDAVPVRRQNCFLGQWPSEHNTNILQFGQESPAQQQRFDVVQGIMKKINLLQQHNHRTKNIATPTVVKRSMRI